VRNAGGPLVGELAGRVDSAEIFPAVCVDDDRRSERRWRVTFPEEESLRLPLKAISMR
jgi:hypothetical protein